MKGITKHRVGLPSFIPFPAPLIIVPGPCLKVGLRGPLPSRVGATTYDDMDFLLILDSQ